MKSTQICICRWYLTIGDVKYQAPRRRQAILAVKTKKKKADERRREKIEEKWLNH